MIQIRNLNKKYDKKILFSNFNYEFDKGNVYIIKGENGKGKTTLINIITLLDKNYQGEILIDGYDISKIKQKEKFRYSYFSYANQEIGLIEEMTIKENIKFFLDTYDEIEEKKLLEGLNLKECINRKYKYLSGGQKQKAKILLSLLQNNQIIILDEPMNNLDEKSNNFLYTYISEFENINDKLIIIVDHLYDDNIKSESLNVLNLENTIIQESIKLKYNSDSLKLKGFNLTLNKIFLFFKKNILKNIVLYLYMFVFLIIFINIANLITVSTLEYNKDRNNQFQDNIAVISTVRDNTYCLSNFDACTSQNFTFNDKQIQNFKQNKGVKNVSNYNLLKSNGDYYFKINNNYTIEQYLEIKKIDLNKLNTYSLIESNQKDLLNDSQIEVKNMNLVNEKEKVEGTSYILKEYNFKKLLYGQIPADNATKEVMIDENLAGYIMTINDLTSMEDIINTEIEVPLSEIKYNKEFDDYDLKQTKDKINLKVVGIYEPIDNLTSNIIFGYNSELITDDYIEKNILSLDDINQKRSEPLSQKQYDGMLEGKYTNIYVEFQNEKYKNKWIDYLKIEYPYLSFYTQEEYRESQEFQSEKSNYKKVLKKEAIILLIMLFVSYYMLKSQKIIERKQVEVLKFYGVDKKQVNKLYKIPKALISIILIIICIPLFSNILIINMFVILIYLLVFTML